MLAIYISLIVLFALAFLQLVLISYEDNKSYKQKQEFIDSIQTGDVFDWDRSDWEPKNQDPFSPDPNTSLIVTISDTRYNSSGEKWVEYYFNDYGPKSAKHRKPATDFIKYRVRIKEGGQ